MRTVLQEVAQELYRSWRQWAGAVGSADAGAREGAQNRIDRIVIELEIFFRCPFPVVNIRLIPYFPKPGSELGVAIPLPQVVHELENEFGPFAIIFGRIGPAGVNAVYWALREVVAIRFRMG